MHVSVQSGMGCFQASNLYKNKVHSLLLFSGNFLSLQVCIDSN